MRGKLIAFEGLDQSGKQTQAGLLRDALLERGLQVESYDFPDYATPVGREIGAALAGQRDFPPDTMQLLYVANRCEHRPAIQRALTTGTWVVCDRFLASSVAYGEAQGLEAAWLTQIQRVLPVPDLTILLDIAPEVAAARKVTDRDRFEQDLALLTRVRESYLRQASQPGWAIVPADRARAEVAADVLRASASALEARQ